MFLWRHPFINLQEFFILTPIKREKIFTYSFWGVFSKFHLLTHAYCFSTFYYSSYLLEEKTLKKTKMTFPCASESRAQHGTQLLWSVTGALRQTPRNLFNKISAKGSNLNRKWPPAPMERPAAVRGWVTPGSNLTATEDQRTAVQFNTGAALRTTGWSQVLHQLVPEGDDSALHEMRGAYQQAGGAWGHPAGSSQLRGEERLLQVLPARD